MIDLPAQEWIRGREERDFLGSNTYERPFEPMRQGFLRFFLSMGCEKAPIVLLLEPSLVITNSFVSYSYTDSLASSSHRRRQQPLESRRKRAKAASKKRKIRSVQRVGTADSRGGVPIPKNSNSNFNSLIRVRGCVCNFLSSRELAPSKRNLFL